MQISSYLDTIIIWMKERFSEILVKIRHDDVIWRPPVGFLRILAQLQSMPTRKSLQNWSNCPTDLLSYFSFVEHSLGFKTSGQTVSHDKNWIFYVNCKNNDGNSWKMTILMTSSLKTDDVIPIFEIFDSESKVHVIDKLQAKETRQIDGVGRFTYLNGGLLKPPE